MDNLRSLRLDKFPNARINQLCGVRKGADKKIDEGILRWFSHVERMKNERIAKRVYVEVCGGSRRERGGLIP